LSILGACNFVNRTVPDSSSELVYKIKERMHEKKCALLQEKIWMDEYVRTSMQIYLYKFSGNGVVPTCCSDMSLCYHPHQMMVF